MRSLTKTGIRILSAKYRSILIKCAIINASVFIGAFGATSAMAANVAIWQHYRGAVNNESDAKIKVNADITYDGSAGATNEINRSLLIIKNTEGNDTNLILDGKYSDVSQTKGLTVGTGGALTLTNITMQNFKNTDTVGGAIYNKGTIESITGDFIGNTSTTRNGGAISNTGTIKSITGDFKDNSANSGGAISNSQNKEINFVAENGKNIEFDGNYVTSSSSPSSPNGKGGAIYNAGGTVGLYAETGRSITFVGGENNVENSKYDIDGIFNAGSLNINGNGTKTYNGTVNLYTVSDYSTPMGTTNIYGGTVNANGNITQNIINVNSGATLASNTAGVEIKADGTDGNLINDGTINITGANSRFGADHLTNNATINITGANSLLETSTLTNNGTIDTVSLLSNSLNNNGNITTSGAIEAIIQNNEGGSITFNGDNVKLTILTNSGTVNFNGRLDTGNSKIQLLQNAGVMNFSTNAIESTANLPISAFYLNGGSVNIADGSVNTLHINQLNLAGNTNFAMDADLAAESMDKIQIHNFTTSTFEEGKVININKINLLSDANDDYVELSLFADDSTKGLLADKVSGNLNGLKYSTIYKYDALYDSATGMIGFTRYNSGTSDDFNPYLYTPSVMANTTAAMTTQIATLAMDKMDDVVHAQGRSGGDTPTSSNAWVKVMGLNDNVEFNNFENIDSKALTVAAGYNTNKITCGDNSVVFGAYAGYIGGKQHYTGNDANQDGGYVGLSSALTLGEAFLTATVNGGLLKNKANNMYGTDRFNTLWLGTGLKAGYNYALTDSVILQPNVYGGYTLVNTEDYTSVSGVKIATNNLNFFEVDPGLKLSAVIADGWTGSVHGKYAIVMDNGADITANDIALQNISPKNYFEYGIGIDKSVTDAFYLGAKINRHDGGRTGWNGSIEFRYKF